MNNLSLFLNTEIQGSGLLSSIGDFGLTPFRYLFDGKTIRIEAVKRDGEETREMTIHHIRSFTQQGPQKRSPTDALQPSSTSKLKAFASVVFLIPGLALSVFKLLAYVFSDVRMRHSLVKERFTPIDLYVGNENDPVLDSKDLARRLLDPKLNLKKLPPINAVIIRGDGTLTINSGLYLFNLNPMKIILDGGKIVRGPSLRNLPLLDVQMEESGKWKGNIHRVKKDDPSKTFVTIHYVDSVKKALDEQVPRRSWLSCKRYHAVYEILPQKSSTQKE